MLFSDLYKINLDGSETWFDPILDDDTLLFVDPFLIYLDDKDFFKGGYTKIMDFFSKVFEEAAITPYIPNSPRLNVLMSRVIFKEPKEACLGYSIGSVEGAGSGAGFAKIIIGAIYESISVGINDLSHFEELGIFSSNIKEDRISDVTINILKEEFIRFTQEICLAQGIPLKNLPCRVFDNNSSRWVVRKYDLPHNPFNNSPVILLPKKFLTSINALNSSDFFDYCWEQYDDNVKDQLNVDIKSKVDKKKIVGLAKSNPDWVSSYLIFKEHQRNSQAYDFFNDPSGVYLWHKATEKFVLKNPLQYSVTDQATYVRFLDDICNNFEDYIENQDGYLMLLDESSKPKREKACQLLLYGMIKHYCKSINCKMDVKQAGKGLINFRFSNNFERTAFIETKHARNSEIIKTFNLFLERCKNGDEVIFGYYILLAFKQPDIKKGSDIEDNLLEMANEHNFRLKFKVLNATIA